MPLDVLGRTRATLTEPASLPPWPEGLGNLVKLCRDGDRTLQLLFFNEEYLVSVSHQLALITSLPFVWGAKSHIKSMASHRKMATLSNCGNALKLQLLQLTERWVRTRVMTSGIVTTLKISQWVIRSQALSRPVLQLDMSAVHRLNVSGRPSIRRRLLKI